MLLISILIIVGSCLISCLGVYIASKIHTLRLHFIMKKCWMLPLTITYKDKNINVTCKKTEIAIPNWERKDGAAHIESVVIYFNEIPALCIVRPFLGIPYAYDRNGYDSQSVYPVLRKINKAWNKEFEKKWDTERKEIKTFF